MVFNKIINTSIGGAVSLSINETYFYQINNTVANLNGTFIVTNKNLNYGNKDGSIQKFIELSYSSSNAVFFNCGIIETNKQLLILVKK